MFTSISERSGAGQYKCNECFKIIRRVYAGPLVTCGQDRTGQGDATVAGLVAVSRTVLSPRNRVRRNAKYSSAVRTLHHGC